MSFYVLECRSAYFGPLLYEINFEFSAPHLPDVKVGDLVRLEEIGDDGKATGAMLAREVAVVSHVGSPVKPITELTLVPLDHPPMRQVELTNEYGRTMTYWVGSHDKLEVGSTIRLLGSPIDWTVSQACTTLPVSALPPKAKVGFLSEVYA